MDHNSDRLSYHLHRYETSITATDRYFDQISPTGPHRASDPYREKSLIASTLKTQEEWEILAVDPFTEYDRINQKLSDLELKRGLSMRNKLLDELRYYMDSYYAGLCWMSLRTMEPEEVSALAPGGIIEILLEELRDDFDLREIHRTFRFLNDAFLSLTEDKEPAENDLRSPACPSGNRDACTCCSREKIREE